MIVLAGDVLLFNYNAHWWREFVRPFVFPWHLYESVCVCVCICEVCLSQNVSQHYLTFSFDKRLPPRQYGFTMSISATGLLAWNRGGGGGKPPPPKTGGPTPAACLPLFTPKVLFQFSAAVNQKPQMGSVEKGAAATKRVFASVCEWLKWDCVYLFIWLILSHKLVRVRLKSQFLFWFRRLIKDKITSAMDGFVVLREITIYFLGE